MSERNTVAHQIGDGSRLVIETCGESGEWIESDKIMEVKK